MGEEVKLLRTWSSPFALRIVWALKLKGIEFETIYEDLLNKSDLLLESNPIYKKVPVLLHDGKSVVESLVILEYIDEIWTNNPLLPQDSYDRSTARFWAKFGDEKVLPSLWAVFKKPGKGKEEAVDQATENLNFVEEFLKGKKFFGGEKFGFLDIVFGWLANLVSVLEEVSDYKIIEETKFPLLFAWMQEFHEVPIIKKNWPDRDKLVVKFQAMREAYLAKAASS